MKYAALPATLATLATLALVAACDHPVRPSATNQAPGRTAQALAPAQSRIAWASTRDGNQDIYIAHGDGSALARLTSDPAADEQPAISPDGRNVAFVSDRAGTSDLYVMGTDGGFPRAVYAGPGSELGPAWSPDGRAIAFVSFEAGTWHVNTVSFDGSSVRRLDSSTNFTLGLDWSPDGTRLLFHRQSGGQYDVYSLVMATGLLTNVTAHPASDAQPAWSPDGKRIAFASDRSSPGDFQIYTMDASGGDVVQVTTDATPAAAPDWSPDGTELVYEAYPVAGVNRGDIHVISPAGTGRRVISANEADERGPTWAPAPVAGGDAQVTGARIVLRYTPKDHPKDVPPPPPSEAGAYWIEGILAAPDRRMVTLGRIHDEATVLGLATGRHELQIGYGPVREGRTASQSPFNFPIELRQTVRGTVVENQVVTLIAELSEALGVARGDLTINGAPPGEGFVTCTFSGQPDDKLSVLLHCAPLPSDGAFRALLPSGRGYMRLCLDAALIDCQARGTLEQRKPDPRRPAGGVLRTFEYDVPPGGTVELEDVAVKTTSLRILLRYRDAGDKLDPGQPASAVGGYLVRGQLSAVTARTVTDLGALGDEQTLNGIRPDRYELTLGYGSPGTTRLRDRTAFPVPLEFDAPLRVDAGENATTELEVQLGEVLGHVSGIVTANGAMPGPGLVVCAFAGKLADVRRGVLLSCLPLAATGSFHQLLPAGNVFLRVCLASRQEECARPEGELRDPRVRNRSLDLALAETSVKAGETVELKAMDVGVSGVRILVQYTPRGGKEDAAVPASTIGSYWLEGELVRTDLRRATLDAVGRLVDEQLRLGTAPGDWELRVWYGPPATDGSRTSTVREPILTTPRVTVGARGFATIVADVGEVLGVVEGSLTVLGAPPGAGFVSCFSSGRVGDTRAQSLGCVPLPPSGVWRQLLPVGDGVARVCEAEHVDACLGGGEKRDPRRPTPEPVATFTYRAEAGRTVTAKMTAP